LSRQHLRISVFWMREGFKLQKMSILKFSDGIEIDTLGELRLLELYDGWYVVGEGRLIPVKDREEGEKKIQEILIGYSKR
jgi:hypothetical protein